jgi:hypothetical protein
VPWNTGGFRDPPHHAVDVAAVYRPAGDGPQDQRSFGSLTTAGLYCSKAGTVRGMMAGLRS